ncbi:MAG: 2,3-bisphosphoglycerate-independent phosphoglycerate mutase [Deltaproteobacteria bacterium]|jgi:2,3-bisphosphoglycerate-independent phosphoglycerate mutase|nr:2,3-bisphosphoglycerate-independent phosphoglycerate mutase [Deltaproteobacteria bacterium]
MKHVLFILDGASDDPLPELGGRTPLEAAFTPHLDFLAGQGSLFRLQTAFEGFPVESLVCIMGILGYDPARYYPHGRASVEALARGIPLQANDLALRCNIVRVSDDGAAMLDFTAGMISDAHARQMLIRLRLPDIAWEVYPGQSYRNLLIIRNARRGAPHVGRELVCAPPHMHTGETIRDLLPTGATPRAHKLALQLSDFLLDTFERFTSRTRPAGCVGNMLWVWSPSIAPNLPSFHERHGLRTFVVAGLDFMHGLGMACDMEFGLVPGATGYMDTAYAAKAEAAITAARDHDFVIVHVNSPDEAAHQHDSRAKIAAIEGIDRFVIAPMLHFLRETHAGAFAVAACADHMTRCSDGKHVGEPTPCLIYPGSGSHAGSRLTERDAAAAPLLPSLRFPKEFFHV